MMNHRCDILNMEWSSRGRDIDIIEPVLCCLEDKYHVSVVRESVWYGQLKLLKYRPKLFLISNCVGADNNANIMKFAHKLGIKTVELSSEGDCFFKPEIYADYFWGCNLDHICYDDLTLYWSEHMREAAYTVPGSEAFDIRVSGATGFDRYQFWPFKTKTEFLNTYHKTDYQKVIGISVYPFEVQDDIVNGNDPHALSEAQRELANTILLYRKPLNEIYSRLVRENRDILFILKLHPGSGKRDTTDCAGLFDEPNVQVIFMEENIAAVINSCDLWLAFESTSMLEAWLLKRPTIAIDPLNISFPRAQFTLGAPKARSYEELKSAIDEFYNTGNIVAFDALAAKRDEVLKSVIGWADGKNHCRAARYIMEVLNDSKEKQRKIDGYIIRSAAKEALRYVYLHTPLRFLSKKKYEYNKHLLSLYDKDERKRITEEYQRLLTEFDQNFTGTAS